MQHPGENETTQANSTDAHAAVSLALTAGLAVGGKLREVHMVEIGPLGLIFKGHLSRELWVELMRMLNHIKRHAVVCMADGVKAGMEWFGEQFVNETLAQLEFDLQDARKAICIGALAEGVRHKELTAEHYWVIGQADLNAAAQRKWSGLAVEHGLTPRDLAQSIESERVITTIAKKGGGTLVTPHAIRQLFDTWWGRQEPVEKMSDEHAKELWAELEAPTRVGVQLASRLGIRV